MSSEEKSNRAGVSGGDDRLDALLDLASTPRENPWFATQLMNKLGDEARDGGASVQSTSRQWLRDLFAGRLRKFSMIAGAAAIAMAATFAFFLPLDREPPGIASQEQPPAEAEHRFLDQPQDEYTEISDDLIVAELEILMAEIQSELWQEDYSL